MSPLNNDSALPPSVNSYRIDLKYLGAPFQGWQSQVDGSGVQDHLQKALSTCLRHEVKVIGASRTDTGVHALHQVAVFQTDVSFDQRKWIKSLQGLLPPAVGIDRIEPVSASFHPILSAKEKVYRYLISTGIHRNPFLSAYVWEVYQEIDVERLKRELSSLVGTHDFSSFCASDSNAKSRIRTINEISVFHRDNLIEIWIRGEGFLKQMIRSIAGTAVHVLQGKLDLNSMTEVLAAKDRTAAGITAPGHGLSLMRISYGESVSVEALRDEAARGLTFYR